jgi:hypothetical protein
MKTLISDPKELAPDTPWLDTTWAWTGEEALVDHTHKARLCAAALLPFRDRKPDWEGFATSIRWMQATADHYGVELVVVLNADTGYIFDLDDAMYAEVLRRFRGDFPTAKFIAGVTARGAQDDTAFKAERYRTHLGMEALMGRAPALDAPTGSRRRRATWMSTAAARAASLLARRLGVALLLLC